MADQANEMASAQSQQQQLAQQHQQGLQSGMQQASGPMGFDQFVSSIGQKESSNNYSARNKNSGAMGKYQIMPANIAGKGRGWDYEATGQDFSAQQFMSSPEIQEKVARYKLQQYYNKYGAAGASVAWYAGPGAAQKYAKTGYASNSTEKWGMPSVASYINNILGK
jgi:hypothetical protein